MFTEKVLKLVAKYDITQELYWNEDLKFWIICNDFFFWGSADGEDINNREDLELLEQSLRDSKYSGALLYCARKRKMRPQGAYYTYIDKEDWGLFNDCGDKRETGLGNPYGIGEYKRENMGKANG